MAVRRIRLGDALALTRTKITPDPGLYYKHIGVKSFGKGIIEYGPTIGAELSKLSYFRIPGDALLLSNIKAWEQAVAITSDRHAEFVASQRFLPYAPKSSETVDVRYLFQYFLSDAGERQLQQASPGSADRNRTLGIAVFENIEIPLPPIDEQRQITAKILSHETPAAASRAVEAKLTTVVPTVRESIFSEDWPRRRIGDVMAFERTRIHPTPAREYHHIGVRSFGRGLIHYGPTRGDMLSKVSYFTFPGEALIISNIKAWEQAVTIIGRDSSRFIASQRFLPYVAKKHAELEVEFVQQYLLTTRGTELLQRSSPGSADRNRTLSRQRFEAGEIPFPPVEIQRQVISKLRQFALAKDLSDRRLTLAEALPKAVRNEIFSKLV